VTATIARYRAESAVGQRLSGDAAQVGRCFLDCARFVASRERPGKQTGDDGSPVVTELSRQVTGHGAA
jgi:hypothetical protein